MLSFNEALDQLSAQVTPISESERVPLQQARGAVCARSVSAPVSVPPFRNSAMDGYAVRHDDAAFAADGDQTLTCIGRSLAGHPWAGTVEPGACVRIFTGAPMPEGADAVLLQEDATVAGDRITFSERPRAGRWVRPAGNDFPAGEELVSAGTTLSPFHLGLLASTGIQQVEVFRAPRVVILSNGDELVEPPQALGPGQIYSSNATVLSSLIEDCGGVIHRSELISDTPEHIDAALRRASTEADLIVSSGGASVGDADHMRAALERLGQIGFWKVAMRPGKPLIFGRIGTALYAGLPGNPASSAVTFLTLIRPVLMRLAGLPGDSAPLLRGTLSAEIERDTTRLDFVRAIASASEDGYTVVPAGDQNSGRLQSLAQANCLLVIDGPERTLTVGERVQFQMLPGASIRVG